MDDDFAHLDLDDGYNYSASMQLHPELAVAGPGGIRFLKEGFIARRISAGQWPKQYFRLTEHALTYHAHPNAEAKGVALIVDITGVSAKFMPGCLS
jgi:hypothetical protein